MTPDDGRHGKTAGYVAGCRGRCCRDAAARYERGRQLDRLRGQTRIIDALGVQRRLQALAALGWSSEEIGRRIGVTGPAVQAWWRLRQPQVHATTARRVAAVYNELSMTRGESAITRRRALKAGWSPPLAWDDDTIDNPDALPAPCLDLADRKIDLSEVEFLASCGEPWSNVARRLGFSRASIETHLHRAGRLDLAHRLAQSSQGEYDLTRPKRRQWST